MQQANNEPPVNEISFVAFDSGTSDDTRRAVRVQAAKASAAARKATIAKKRAEQKRNIVGAESPRPTGPPKETLKQWDSRSAKRQRSSPSLSPGPSKAVLRGKGIARARPPAPERRQLLEGQDGSLWQQASTGTTIPKPPLPTPHDSQLSVPGFCRQHITPEEARSRTPPVPCQCCSCMPDLERYARHACTVSFSGVDYTSHNLPAGAAEMPSTAPLSMPSVPSLATEKADPFNCYPVPYHRMFDQLLHHMLTVFAPRGWPALKISQREGLNWEWFMQQHALAEPALFYVRLLFASGDLMRLNVLKPEVSWWLQSLAVNTINEALRDPERATSDGLILAVGRIALHETLYGDLDAASNMHRPAQRLMIEMRGGMQALPFPELVKRLMRWSDRMMSMRSGTPRLLPDEEDLGNRTFSLAESVDVMDRWHPHVGQAIRKKIATSDLVD